MGGGGGGVGGSVGQFADLRVRWKGPGKEEEVFSRPFWKIGCKP